MPINHKITISIFVLIIACGDDTTADCPAGFVRTGAACAPLDAGVDGARRDAESPVDAAEDMAFSDGAGDALDVGDTALDVGSVLDMGSEPDLGALDAGDDAGGPADAGDDAPPPMEICNGLDDDGDLRIDEGFDVHAYHEDRDADSYGSSTTCVSCGVALCDGVFVERGGDCDDTRPDVNPDETEICNGRDDDCDTSTDEGVTTTYYRDQDGDTYGDASQTRDACSLPAGYVTRAGDCGPADENANPLATGWYTTAISGLHPGFSRFDYNCSGQDDREVRYQLQSSCNNSGGRDGLFWDRSSAPVCGDSARQYQCLCFGSNCAPRNASSRTVACH